MPYTNDTKPTTSYSNDSKPSGSYSNDIKPVTQTVATWANILTTWANETQTWALVYIGTVYSNDTKPS